MQRFTAGAGSRGSVPEELLAPFLCELLECSPSELVAMQYDEREAFIAYAEGRALAQWVAENPNGKR